MKKLSLAQMEKLQGGKFWGSETTCGAIMDNGSGVCTQTCTQKYYMFWIVVSSESWPVFYACQKIVL